MSKDEAMKKRYFYILAAILLACACSTKELETEIETPQEADAVHTELSAIIDNDADTKTEYSIDEVNKKARFAWAAGDGIDVVVNYNGVYTPVRFITQSAGTEVTFQDGTVAGDETLAGLLAKDSGATLSNWAFYPSLSDDAALNAGYGIDWSIKKTGGEEILSVDVPSELVLPTGNPLSIVPLLGRQSGASTYIFKPMMSVLAVPVTNLPYEADFASISCDGAAISGYFQIPESATAITQADAVTAQHSLTLNFSGLCDDVTFYFPVPSGTIPAGLTLKVGTKADPDACMTITTKKALTLEQGKITKTPALNFTPVDQQWATYATGTFIDDFIWGQHSKFTSGTRVPVTIERSGLHPEKYRIANPYTTACAQFGYTPYAEGITADDFFIFFIEGGNLRYKDMCIGVEDKDTGGKPMMISYRTANAANTYIAASLTDGTPLELLFGALYSDPNNSGYYYTRDGSSNQTIHVYIDDSTPQTWTSIGTCTFIDNYIWPFAGLTDPVERDIQQFSHNANRFRIAKPYPASDADEWFEFNVANPSAVTSVNHYTGVTVNDETNTSCTWKAVVWNGAYGYDYSTVLSTQSNGLPLEVQIGPCYRDSDGIFTSTYNYDYEVGKDHSPRVIDIIFPSQPETWTSLGKGRYMDEWMWKANGFAPYDVEVEVWRSDLDPNRYRINNPYPVANTAFKRTAATTDADEYMYLQVDPSTGYVTFGSVITGMTRGSEIKNFAIADAATWESIKTSGAAISASDSKVIAGSNTAPQKIQLYSVYYDSAAVSYFYTNSTLHKYLWFPGYYHESETWSYCCDATYVDGTYDGAINGSDAIGTVAVTIEQSSVDSKRFRVANPYRANVASDYLCASGIYDEYLYFNYGSVNDYVYSEPFRPGVKMNPNANPSYELGMYHPVNSNLMGWSQGGSDFAQSSILEKNSDGTPKKIRLGLHYFDIAGPTPEYCYTRQGSGRADSERVIITFGATDKAVVTHYELALKASFHNPVAVLSLPSGTLERLVVKISGIDPSDVSGLRLYQSGWMDSDYVAPDANGVVTMTSFTNPTVSSGIDLNFWMNGSPVGSSLHFTVQEVVVDGVSLPIIQEDVPHLGGIVVNTGGDEVNVRGSAETVASFRIPALVTSNAGTLIAAYDVRYDSSADLQGDIDVGVKRSTDGGKTWSNLILAMDMGTYGYDDEIAAGTMTWKQAQQNNGIGDPCLLVDENTGRIFCFAVWGHGHRNDSDIRCLAWASTGFDIGATPQFIMVYSDDDGVTWSEPVNITRQIKKFDWRMTFQGPGRGITMKDGTLVIPIQHQEGTEKNMHSLYPLNSGIAYSTDHGLTWHAHNFAHPVTSESAVAEVEPGVLMLSMRDETDSHYRRVFTTTDLGRSWTAHSTNGKVYEESACEASLIHVDASDNVLGQDILLMSNPQGTTGWRDHITIQASLDKGATWTHKLLVDAGSSLGYSCLTMVDNATVGILYESSRGNIFFQAVPLVDIIK